MMTETIFEIGRFNKPLYRTVPETPTTYNSFVQQFCTNSYALYTEYFIKKIAQDAQNNHNDLLKFCLKRYLRKCVKKFMLTDLELIFLAFYCETNSWKFETHPNIANGQAVQYQSSDQKQQKNLQIFLDLNAYFVKSYVGDTSQFQAIKTYMLEIFPKFNQIYQSWVTSKPKENFVINPRKINDLYRKYSRNCQQQSNKKDYNQIVNTIIDLSTTYSIIPNKKGETNKKQKEVFNEKNVEQGEEKRNKRNVEKQRVNNSDIFRIAQHSQFLDQSEQPRYKERQQFHEMRYKGKSSFVFQSLPSLSRKSELIAQNHINPCKETKPLEVIKTEEKKHVPNKVSLTFKKKQKPNETVIGFLGQQSEIKMDVLQKGKNEKNQNNRDNNMSFINLRSNRSSRSNSQLPFLWKPSEDNFFQKSKFG